MMFNTQLALVATLTLLSLVMMGVSEFAGRVSSYSLSPDFSKGAEYMKVKHLGTLNLHSQRVDGIAIGKLSGLAWDADAKRLYAVSDNGFLFGFSIETNAGFLTTIKPVSAVPLLNQQHLPLSSPRLADAEGLAIINAHNGQPNDTILLVSFEFEARVAAYSTTGKWLYNLPLPEKLQRPENYHRRNAGLESILVHPEYGVIVTPEISIKKAATHKRVMYTVNPDRQGLRWQFLSLPYQESGVTGMDVAPDGSVIFLERSWPGAFSPLVIGLRRIKLEQCRQFIPCPIENLALFDSNKGWLIDNYEGLSHYQGNQFFMVSDDNIGILQNTLITLIEVKM